MTPGDPGGPGRGRDPRSSPHGLVTRLRHEGRVRAGVEGRRGGVRWRWARVGRRLRPAVNSMGREVQVTASIGLAAWPEHGRTDVEVLAAADQALYAAKGTGRNRAVTCWELADRLEEMTGEPGNEPEGVAG